MTFPYKNAKVLSLKKGDEVLGYTLDHPEVMAFLEKIRQFTQDFYHLPMVGWNEELFQPRDQVGIDQRFMLKSSRRNHQEVKIGYLHQRRSVTRHGWLGKRVERIKVEMVLKTTVYLDFRKNGVAFNIRCPSEMETVFTDFCEAFAQSNEESCLFLGPER